ncbi:MAG: hypothetical protein IJS87_02245 [Rhodocyclaceae bacterium]|nr:hypothetical protein [Rhodocyclaceae bacterium]
MNRAAAVAQPVGAQFIAPGAVINAPAFGTGRGECATGIDEKADSGGGNDAGAMNRAPTPTGDDASIVQNENRRAVGFWCGTAFVRTMA